MEQVKWFSSEYFNPAVFSNYRYISFLAIGCSTVTPILGVIMLHNNYPNYRFYALFLFSDVTVSHDAISHSEKLPGKSA